MNDVVNLLLSFIAIVFASWCIGEGGDILGKKYDASIVGGLVIAWLNTAPETIFFLFSLEGRNPHFAIGAVSGSTVVVSTIALGVCIYFGSLRRTNKYFYLLNSVKQQCFILLSSGLIPLTIAIVGYNYIIAIFGAFCYMCFVFYELLKSKNSEAPKITTTTEGDVEQGGIEPLDESSDDSEPTWKGVLFLFVGGGFIFLFSDNFISSSVNIAKSLNVNAILLSFFLAPIASEMPEILESISLARKGSIQSLNVAFSNLVGGTISKTTLLCGIFAYYGVNKELPWESPNFSVSLILLALSAVTAACIGYFIAKLRNHHSYILFILFIVSGIIQFFLNADMHLPTNKNNINV